MHQWKEKISEDSFDPDSIRTQSDSPHATEGCDADVHDDKVSIHLTLYLWGGGGRLPSLFLNCLPYSGKKNFVPKSSCIFICMY